MNTLDSSLDGAQKGVIIHESGVNIDSQTQLTREDVCHIILDKAKESRHCIQNKTTKYLDNLEAEGGKSIALLENLSQLLETSDASIKDEYIDKIGEDIYALNCELDKLNKIVVIDDDHISIGGFVHKLGVHTLVQDNPKSGIININGQTFFNHRAATSVNKQLIGYKLYTQRELEVLIDAIPGYPLGNQIQILLDLLQIPLVGVYSYEENSLDNTNNTVHLGTSTRTRQHGEELYTKCIIDKEEFEYPEFEEDAADSFSLLLLHKDRKKSC